MMPPSNFVLRIIVEEAPKLVRSLNAHYADAAADGGLEPDERDALFDAIGRHFTGPAMALLWRDGRHSAVHGRPPGRHGGQEMEGRSVGYGLMVERMQ
jgi:hypothetical protein